MNMHFPSLPDVQASRQHVPHRPHNNSEGPLDRTSHVTEQGEQTFSGKDQTVNVLGSAGHVVSVNSALVAQKDRRQHVSQCPWP